MSFGDGCANPNKPGVYTRVSSMMKWIQRNTEGAAYIWDSDCHLVSAPDDDGIDFLAQQMDHLFYVHVILVIIVTGGDNDDTVEVLSSSGKSHTCTMPSLPSPRAGHTQNGLGMTSK